MGQSLVNNMYTSSYLKEYVGFISKRMALQSLFLNILHLVSMAYHGEYGISND